VLNARDVHDKQFRLVRQSTGYDIDEVDAFLDEVEATIAALTAQLEETRAVGGTGADSGQQSTSAGRILELAQRTADEYLAEARRAADSLRADAEREARAIVADLQGQRVDLEARVAALGSLEAQVRSHLTEYLEAQLRGIRSPGAPPASDPTT
jgi:DivIVA domain-containing protein